MKVQPEAHNAITIELDDGAIFRLHHTLHDNKDYLFINAEHRSIFEVDKSKGLEWENVYSGTGLIRISKAEGK